MNTPDIKQRTPLNGFHARKHKSQQRTYVPHNGTLPPTDVLAAIGAPAEIVAQVQTFHDLKDAERDYARKAARANIAAEAATAEYRRTVRETIAAGGDPDEVKDQTEKHKAIGKAHAQFSADARAEREHLGYTLGPQLEAIASDLFANAEAEIDKAAAVLSGALAGIRSTWEDYSAAFALRYWLSHLALNGGKAAVYHGATKPPEAVTQAVDALEHEASAVSRLRADEAQVAEYRKANR